MGIGTGTAALIGGVASAGAGIASGVMGANAASDAANTQSQAAIEAAKIQAQTAKNALDFQKQVYGTSQQQIAPWIQQGTQAINTLGSLNQQGTFNAPAFVPPTDVTQQNDPGYQFRLNQGLQALQQSASARGGLLSGGTAKDIQNYGQNYASNEYGNVYNRALTQYQLGLQNQQNQFNRLATLSGIGQIGVGQSNTAGQSAAGNVANISLTSGQQQGNALQNAAAAQASGYIGGANAITGGIGSATSGIQNMLLLNSLGNMFGGGGGAGGVLGSLNPTQTSTLLGIA